MAMIALPRPIWIPGHRYADTVANAIIDADGECQGIAYTQRKARTLVGAWVSFRAITSSQSVTIAAESLDASGNASGTVLGATNNAKGDIAAPAVGAQYVAFGESAALSQGQKWALTCRFTSTAGHVTLWGHGTSAPYVFAAGAIIEQTDYCTYNGGSWAKGLATVSIIPVYSDGMDSECQMNFFLTTTDVTMALSSSTTPDEVGNKITLASALTLDAIGIAHGATSARDADAVLYNADGDALRTGSYSGGFSYQGKTGFNVYPFTSAYEAAAGTYRYTYKPTTTLTMTITRNNWSPETLAANGAVWPGGCHGTTRVDGGAWTDDDDMLYAIYLRVTHIEDGGAGGGGGGGFIAPPGFGLPPRHR